MTSNYKNSMYSRSFLCEEAKIKQRTPLKKELCEIGEETLWESRFTSFFSNSFKQLVEKRMLRKNWKRHSSIYKGTITEFTCWTTSIPLQICYHFCLKPLAWPDTRFIR